MIVRHIVRHQARGGACVAVLAVSLAGCPDERVGVPPVGSELSHAEALGAARAMHTTAIDQATFAEARLRRGMVEGLASAAVQDHRRSLEELQRLAFDRSLTPSESAVSLQLREAALGRLDELTDESGRDLAEDFLEAQLELHQQSVDVIDRALLAATSDDPALLKYMSELRALMVRHIELARDVQRQEQHRGLAGPPDHE